MTQLDTWSDLNGQYDLTAANGTPEVVDSGVGGNQSVRFTGSEYVEADYSGTVDQPYSIAMVAQCNTTGGTIISGESSADFSFDSSGGTFSADAGSTIDGASADTDPHVFIIVVDGSNSILRVDDNEYTGDLGSNGLNGMTLGSSHDQSSYFDGWVGELRVYNERLGQAKRDDLVTNMATDWEIAEEVTIDDFEGSVDSAWTGSDAHAVSSTVAADGADSAYRTGSTSLRAGAGDLDARVEQGGWFVTASFYSQSGSDNATLEWGRADYSTLDGYRAVVDWSTGEFFIDSRVSGNETTLDLSNVSISSGSWYDVTVVWTSDGGLKAWLTERSSGSVLTSVEDTSSDHSGDVMAIWLSESGDTGTRVDDVRATSVHPYTGDHFTDISVSSTEDPTTSYPSETTVESGYTALVWDSSTDESVFHSTWETSYNSITTSNTPPDGTAVLRTDLPNGSHYGSDMTFQTGTEYGQYYDNAHLRFEIYLDPGININHQLKLHAIGGRGNYHSDWSEAGWGGRQSDGTNGWSTRVSLDDDSSPVGLEWYTYHADMSGSYGDHFDWGRSLSAGEWHTIDVYVEMNTPGANDGIQRAWVNGNLAHEMTNMKFRESGYGHIAIDQFHHNIYHGGDDPSPQSQYVDLNNHEIWWDQGQQL